MLTRKRRIALLAILAGFLLALIGFRFLIVPDSAIRTFGLSPAITGHQLHGIIGLRDLWLGVLAVALAVLSEWRALALWLFLGVLVCWGDALIVATSGGNMWAIVFHAVSGVYCLALGIAVWRLFVTRRSREYGELSSADRPAG